jgi:hypothetical protein
MRAIAWLLRIFCYLFHTILSLSLLALGGVAVLSGVHDMKLETLPWQGTQLNHWLLILGTVGLFSVLLAVTGKLRFLLSAWSIYAMVMLVRGVFFSSMTFEGREDFHNWLWLIAGAAVALIGSMTSPGKRRA